MRWTRTCCPGWAPPWHCGASSRVLHYSATSTNCTRPDALLRDCTAARNRRDHTRHPLLKQQLNNRLAQVLPTAPGDWPGRAGQFPMLHLRKAPRASLGRSRTHLPISFALALLLGALSPLAAAPASGDVLVSNIEQSEEGTSHSAFSGFGLVFFLAQRFTTGSNSAGYNLESIGITFATQPTSGLTAQLWSARRRGRAPTLFPNEKLQDLAVRRASQPALSTSAAPQGTTLDANTSYFVVFSADDGSIENTDSNAEDAGAAPGWSIADDGYSRAESATSWNRTTVSRRIRVNGTAIVPPKPPSSRRTAPRCRTRGRTSR